MINFRKILICVIALTIATVPCVSFASDALDSMPKSKVLAPLIEENFDNIPDDLEYWSLSEYIDNNSEVFESYRVMTKDKVVYLDENKTEQSAQIIDSAQMEKNFRNATNAQFITETSRFRSKNGKLNLLKTAKGYKNLFHVFTLKRPITEGVHRFCFEFTADQGSTSWNDSFFKFYEETPTPAQAASGADPFAIFGFNGDTLYFNTKRAESDNLHDKWNQKGSSSTTLGGYTYAFEFIVDMDSHTLTVFKDGAFWCEGPIFADGFGAFSINNGSAANWLSSLGGDANFWFDNFSSEELASPTYNFNIAEGETVSADTKPQIVFDAPVDNAVAKAIKLYKNGEALDAAAKLTDDGLTIDFVGLTLDYSSEYKIEVPEGQTALNKVKVVPKTLTFHTEHKQLGVVVDSEDKPAYVKDADYSASATLTNTTGAPVSITYVVGIYDDNMVMVNAAFFVKEIGAGATETLSVTLSDAVTKANIAEDSSIENATVKTFLIDGFTTLGLVVTDIK